jgi:hypothetical protein
VEIEKCGQHGCTEAAAYRYTWPGRDEAGVCEAHVGKLRGVANAMGLPLQVIPLEPAVPAAPERPLPRKVDTVFGSMPRRNVLSFATPMERAVRAALDAIEAGPADVRLTRAVVAVGDALAWVADYYEDVPGAEHFPRVAAAGESKV